ncbi:transcription initiation factor TFIIIB [Bacillus cereus]|nr:transcription initiation factor TFIIIB [Bacillus cereus]MDA2572687.1 transcription initiation factor TFIIIB [Bacillus cereus]
MDFIFQCTKCGHNNTEEDIDYTNTTCGGSCGCEGYEYDLTCSECGNEIYIGSEFGQFDRKEVAEEIQEELLTNN